jgi:PleD family two-component response regulator
MIDPIYQINSPLILIVHDERTLGLLLRRAIEREGYQVVEASNGQQCLKICKEQPPDMVLLSDIMPDMDGFTCCSRLQTLLGDRCPPILMMTASCDQEFMNRAVEVGATAYITKPVNWQILRQRVHRLLAHKWVVESQYKMQWNVV